MSENEPTDFDANPFGEGPEMLGEPPATPPTDELTDERLAAIEDRWTENGLIHGDIHTLIQEVRRLRGLVEDRGEAIARAGTAEAEVERLRDHIRLEQAEVREYMEGVEAERDRYVEALKEIIRLAEEPHLQIARAGGVALAALDQEAVREEGEKE